jgi:hypothetical protein
MAQVLRMYVAPTQSGEEAMSKSVIIVTVAGALWVASGSALAQASNNGRGPAAGVNPSALNVIAIPSVSAINMPIATAVARTQAIGVNPPGLVVAASKFAIAEPSPDATHPDKSPGTLSVTSDTRLREKLAKESDASLGTHVALRSDEQQAKRTRQIPFCE